MDKNTKEYAVWYGVNKDGGFKEHFTNLIDALHYYNSLNNEDCDWKQLEEITLIKEENY